MSLALDHEQILARRLDPHSRIYEYTGYTYVVVPSICHITSAYFLSLLHVLFLSLLHVLHSAGFLWIAVTCISTIGPCLFHFVVFLTQTNFRIFLVSVLLHFVLRDMGTTSSMTEWSSINPYAQSGSHTHTQLKGWAQLAQGLNPWWTAESGQGHVSCAPQIRNGFWKWVDGSTPSIPASLSVFLHAFRLLPCN